jgi:hypothetical protein
MIESISDNEQLVGKNSSSIKQKGLTAKMFSENLRQ